MPTASDFIDTLLAIGSETEIITEAVHGSAQTLDSRHFAEEFVRRKKQADKGIVVETVASPSTAKAAENAWSAVAKKSGGVGSPVVQASSPASGEFKVAKAKGRRK
jgi:PERQ amino acid-rich with GYF domain-containing protein